MEDNRQEMGCVCLYHRIHDCRIWFMCSAISRKIYNYCFTGLVFHHLFLMASEKGAMIISDLAVLCFQSCESSVFSPEKDGVLPNHCGCIFFDS